MAETTAEETPAPQDQSQVTDAPSTEETSATPEAKPFEEGFDPSTLDEALQGRYREMESGLTKKFQELAEQRKQAQSITDALGDLRSNDPEARQAAAQWLAANDLLTEEAVAEAFGWDIVNDDEEPVDEATRLRQEFDAWKAEQASEKEQAAQEARIAAADAHIGKTIDAISKEIGRDLSEKEQELLVSRTLVAYPQGDDGLPDVRSAWNDLKVVLDDFQKSWAEGKRTAQPTVPGSTATGVPDLDNMSTAERHAWLQEQVRLREEGAQGT